MHICQLRFQIGSQALTKKQTSRFFVIVVMKFLHLLFVLDFHHFQNDMSGIMMICKIQKARNTVVTSVLDAENLIISTHYYLCQIDFPS